MSGIEIAPGSKIFTARCKNIYVLTTKHKITAKNKINRIKIEDPFEQIVRVIDNTNYSYKDIDIEDDLEIVSEIISTSKRVTYETPQLIDYETPQSSKRVAHKTIRDIKPYHFYIIRIINQKRYLIFINIGQEENYIARELVRKDEIKSNEYLCPDLPKTLTNTIEIAEKEIIIGGILIIIEFNIYKENITLWIKWLEKMKSYNLENTQLTINYKNKKVIIKRSLL